MLNYELYACFFSYCAVFFFFSLLLFFFITSIQLEVRTTLVTVAPPCGHGKIVLDAEISSLSMEETSPPEETALVYLIRLVYFIFPLSQRFPLSSLRADVLVKATRLCFSRPAGVTCIHRVAGESCSKTQLGSCCLRTEKGWHHTLKALAHLLKPLCCNKSSSRWHTHTQQGLSGRKEEEGDFIVYCRSFIFKFHCDRETEVDRGVEKENMFVIHFNNRSSFEEGGGSDQMCLMKGLHSNRNNKRRGSLWNGVLSTPW